jgi:hypothetical protein
LHKRNIRILILFHLTGKKWSHLENEAAFLGLNGLLEIISVRFPPEHKLRLYGGGNVCFSTFSLGIVVFNGYLIVRQIQVATFQCDGGLPIYGLIGDQLGAVFALACYYGLGFESLPPASALERRNIILVLLMHLVF